MESKPAEDGLVGISLRGTQLRMAEATKHNNRFSISKVAGRKTDQTFDLYQISKRESISAIAEEIDKLYESSGIETDRASFSLNSNMVLIKKVPYDFSLNENEVKDHVYWETSQFLVGSLQDHVVDYYLQDQTTNGADNTLILVVVRRAIIDYLQEIFASTKLHLKAIDVDVFAAQRVIEMTYDLPAEAKISLIDIRKSNIQFSVLHNGFYLEQEVDLPESIFKDTDAVEKISRLISKEMRRIILDNKLGKSVDDMQEIFIYGDEVNDEVIELLVQAHDVNLHRVNPFEKITLQTTPFDPEVTNHPEAFVTSVGTAIKGF